MKLGLICMLLLYLNCLGQQNSVKTEHFSIGTTIAYHPLDFFHGIEISRKTSRISPTFTFAYGVKTSIFQTRFFPSLQLFIPYQFQKINQKNSRFNLGIGPTLNYYFLKLNKSSSHRQFWQEYLLSYRFEYGEKWKITQQSGFGIRFERYFSDLEKKFKQVSTPSYSVTIGLAYRL